MKKFSWKSNLLLGAVALAAGYNNAAHAEPVCWTVFVPGSGYYCYWVESGVDRPAPDQLADLGLTNEQGAEKPDAITQTPIRVEESPTSAFGNP